MQDDAFFRPINMVTMEIHFWVKIKNRGDIVEKNLLF